MRERKLAVWEGAGVIDAETAARIRAYEAEHARPLALWAAIGIGVLAIGLGLVSVVAANWDAIPGATRLALHFALMTVVAAGLWWRGDALARERPWAGEALLFVLGVLGLTFFGHLGQVYQMSSPLWQALAMWLLLFAPLILLRGQGWLMAALLMGVLVYACFDFAARSGDSSPGGQWQPNEWLSGLALGLPVLAAPLGAWMRGRGGSASGERADFWRRLEQLGFAYVLLAASVVLAVAGTGDFSDGGGGPFSRDIQFVQGLFGFLLAGPLVAWGRPGASGRSSALVVEVASIALMSAGVVSGSALGAGLAFLVLWCVVAAAAQMAGWRGVFQLAVAVVALRLVVLSFELASDLLLSGFGLIVAGLLILGIAWLALRVSRRYAPPAEGAAA